MELLEAAWPALPHKTLHVGRKDMPSDAVGATSVMYINDAPAAVGSHAAARYGITYQQSPGEAAVGCHPPAHGKHIEPHWSDQPVQQQLSVSPGAEQCTALQCTVHLAGTSTAYLSILQLQYRGGWLPAWCYSWSIDKEMPLLGYASQAATPSLTDQQNFERCQQLQHRQV